MNNTQKTLIVVALIIVVGAVLAFKAGRRGNGGGGSCCSPSPRQETGNATTMPSDDGGQQGASAGATSTFAESPKRLPRLVDLGSTTCVPCKMMEPILEELREQYAGKLTVEFINVHRSPEAARSYGIRLIPTQVFFDAKGREVFRHTGFFAKAEIERKLAEMGVR